MVQRKKPGLLDLVARVPASDLARMARSLGLDPEGVLKRLQALESTRLGGVLVDTATRALKPGEAAGRIVIDHATRILSQARDLTRDLEELAGLQAPELHFGADGYCAELSVGLALGHMVGANSRLRAKVDTGDFTRLAHLVAAHELEFAIAEAAGADRLHARLEVEPIGEHTLFFYVRNGHPLAGRDTLELPTILVFPLVAPRLPKRIAAEVASISSAIRIERDVDDGVSSLAIEAFPLARAVVLASDAVGLAPLLALETDLRAQRVALLPYTSRWLRLRNGVFYARKRQPSRVAQLFITQLRQVEATLHVREQRALARLEDTKRRTPRRKSGGTAAKRKATATTASRSPRKPTPRTRTSSS